MYEPVEISAKNLPEAVAAFLNHNDNNAALHGSPDGLELARFVVFVGDTFNLV